MTFKKLLSSIRQSLQGVEHDYTKGNISEAIILLAIPMILELSLESVFAIVDMFFVSKLGPNAIATVGLTEAVITLVYSIAIGISTGATAIVARRIGEKNPEAAAHAGAQSLILALIGSVFISIGGVYFASDILSLMGASREVIQEGSSFTQIMIGGNTVILLLFLINGIFRGAGDATMAMKSLWIASGTNILLCPVLIQSFGLKGAAIATVIGRSSGVVYQLYHLTRGSRLIRFRFHHFRLDIPILNSIIKVARPASLQFIIGSGSWILLTRLVAETGGTAASAGCQIAFRNFVFFILPAWGLSNAAATLVGQNLGAKQIERAEESVFKTAKYSAFLMTFVTAFFLLCAEPLVRIFSTDPEVIQNGIQSLRIIGSGFVFYGVGMVVTQALNGAGDTKTPTWINFICLWIFQIPLAYFLAIRVNLQMSGTMLTLPLSQALLTGVAWFYFKKGKWKEIQV